MHNSIESLQVQVLYSDFGLRLLTWTWTVTIVKWCLSEESDYNLILFQSYLDKLERLIGELIPSVTTE